MKATSMHPGLIALLVDISSSGGNVCDVTPKRNSAFNGLTRMEIQVERGLLPLRVALPCPRPRRP